MIKQKESVPQIRFPKFNKNWELKYLHGLLKETKTKNADLYYDKDDVLSVSRDYGVVNQIEHLRRSYAGESVHKWCSRKR